MGGGELEGHRGGWCDEGGRGERRMGYDEGEREKVLARVACDDEGW